MTTHYPTSPRTKPRDDLLKKIAREYRTVRELEDSGTPATRGRLRRMIRRLGRITGPKDD